MINVSVSSAPPTITGHPSGVHSHDVGSMSWTPTTHPPRRSVAARTTWIAPPCGTHAVAVCRFSRDRSVATFRSAARRASTRRSVAPTSRSSTFVKPIPHARFVGGVARQRPGDHEVGLEPDDGLDGVRSPRRTRLDEIGTGRRHVGTGQAPFRTTTSSAPRLSAIVSIAGNQ